MSHRNRWIFGGLVLVAALFTGCTPRAEAAPPPAVTVKDVEGTDLKLITLSDEAAQRLGLETVEVAATTIAGASAIVPYAAVLYDVDGLTWVYTNPTGLDFVRHQITVDRIVGGDAFLTDGPPVGTKIVTVGVAELHGVDAGVGGGH